MGTARGFIKVRKPYPRSTLVTPFFFFYQNPTIAYEVPASAKHHGVPPSPLQPIAGGTTSRRQTPRQLRCLRHTKRLPNLAARWPIGSGITLSWCGHALRLDLVLQCAAATLMADAYQGVSASACERYSRPLQLSTSGTASMCRATTTSLAMVSLHVQYSNGGCIFFKLKKKYKNN